MLKQLADRPSLISDRRGVALIEFAAVLPLLVLLFVGIIDFSRILWISSSVEHAAAEATRYAVVRGASTGNPASAADIAAYATDSATGIKASDLAVAVSWAPSNFSGGAVTVVISYDYGMLLGGMLPVGPIEIEGESTMVVY